MASDPSSLSEFGKRYLLSVVAAGVAETVTFPLDLTKTRMQIQGEYKFEAFNQDDALDVVFIFNSKVSLWEVQRQVWWGLR